MVEILIVLVILAVIAGGASGIMGGTITKTKYVTAQTDLDVISQGFARYLEVTWDLEGIVNGADLDSCLTASGRCEERYLPGGFREEVGRF